MVKTIQYICNAFLKVSQKYIESITYLLKLGRVLHSPTKTLKQSNTFLGAFSKHHGLNYFGLNYQKILFMTRNIQCTCNTLRKVSLKSFKLYNISFETWKNIYITTPNLQGNQYPH
jgi:hypothetical protein